MPHSIFVWTLGLVCVATRVRSQAAPDSAVHRFHVDASGLRPSQFVYQTTLDRAGATTPLGLRTVTVSETNYAGAPAWLLVETRIGDAVPSADSLTTTRADLRPVHWSSTLGSARVALEFAGDSVFGVVSAPQGRRSIVAGAPGGVLVNASMLETVLRLLPFQAGWQDSTISLSLTLAGATTSRTQLALAGEERLTVPAGAFECWVVTANTDTAHATFWISKRDATIVQSTQTIGSSADGRLTYALAR